MPESIRGPVRPVTTGQARRGAEDGSATRVSSPSAPPPASRPTPPPAMAGDRRLTAATAAPTASSAARAMAAEAMGPERPIRGLYPWVQARLERSMAAISARRVEVPAVVTRTGPDWDPATAGKNGDGSIAPPTARSTAGAPAPGQGAASPTGLSGGNSVFRYGEGGDPMNFHILDQGATNGCGTTSLAMILNYHAGGGRTFDREAIDRQIRHYNMFTSPGDIAAFAERQGLEAAVTTGTSLADLRRLIDQGLPVQVLLDVSESHDATGLHYEVVTGYGTGPDGQRYVELANPWGKREFMAEDAFVARWSSFTAKGMPLGIDRVAISLKPAGHPARLPADRRGSFLDTGMTALRVAEGLTQVTSGWARSDAALVAGGAVRLVAGGLVALPALLGNAAGDWGAARASEGRRQLGEGLGGTLAGLGKLAVGGLAWVASRPLEAVGNGASRVVDLVASGVTGLGRGIGKVISAL